MYHFCIFIKKKNTHLHCLGVVFFFIENHVTIWRAQLCALNEFASTRTFFSSKWASVPVSRFWKHRMETSLHAIRTKIVNYMDAERRITPLKLHSTYPSLILSELRFGIESDNKFNKENDTGLFHLIHLFRSNIFLFNKFSITKINISNRMNQFFPIFLFKPISFQSFGPGRQKIN